MHQTEQPGWQGRSLHCPSLLPRVEAGTLYLELCNPLSWSQEGSRGLCCWMPNIEVRMEKMGDKGAFSDTAPAALCSLCRGEQLMCTQKPAAQNLHPPPSHPAPLPLEKPPISPQQEPSRAARGARWGKQRGFSSKIPLQVLQPLLLHDHGARDFGWAVFTQEFSLCLFRSKITLQSCLFLKGSNLACQSRINSFHSTNQ